MERQHREGAEAAAEAAEQGRAQLSGTVEQQQIWLAESQEMVRGLQGELEGIASRIRHSPSAVSPSLRQPSPSLHHQPAATPPSAAPQFASGSSSSGAAASSPAHVLLAGAIEHLMLEGRLEGRLGPQPQHAGQSDAAMHRLASSLAAAQQSASWSPTSPSFSGSGLAGGYMPGSSPHLGGHR